MAFANVAGRAGFVLDLDKSALDSGLPEAERQFTRSVDKMTASAQKMTASGLYSPQQVDLAKKYGLTDLISQNDELEARLSKTNAQIGELEAGADAAGAATERFGAGMAGAAVRAGVIGIAVGTAYQASRRLQEGLLVTGEEAFRTEGRLRNMGSALLSGDLIGGFEALSRQPKTLEELGISAQEAAGNLEALEAIAFGTAKAQADITEQTEGSSAALMDYKEAAEEAGTGSAELAGQLLEQGRAWLEIEKATRATLEATLGLRDAQGSLIAGTTFGLRLPRDPTLEEQLAAGGFPQDRARRFDRPEIAAREAARGDDEAQLRAAQEAARRARLRVQIVQREGPLLAQRRREEQDALDRVDAIQDRIAADRQAARNKRAAEAQAARDEAARALRERLQTREQNLRNAYERALQTPGMRDDARTFGTLRSFLQAEGRDQRLDPGERASYRGELVTLRGQRRKDIAEAREAANEETRDHLEAQEEVLKNRVAAAELTEKNKADDLKALRALRDFYRRSAKDEKDVYSEIEQIQFRGDATATQKKINDVLRGKKDGSSGFDEGAFARNLLAAQQQIWTGMMSQFLGGTGAGNAMQTHALEQFTLQGNQERAEQTRHLRAIAGRGGGRALDEASLG